MALNAALVDRARKVTKDAAGVVVDGETLYADSFGPWFKARINLGSEGESVDNDTGMRAVNRTPSLLVALRDENGDLVTLNVEDRLEYLSRQLPDASTLWDVISDPQPLRKRRSVIGSQVTIRHVYVHAGS